MELSMKPGCFGSPLCYNKNQTPCSFCNYNATCEVASDQMAQVLREKHGFHNEVFHKVERTKRKTLRVAKAFSGVGVAPRIPQPPRQASVPVSAPVPSTLPKKSQELLAKLQARGIDLRKAVTERHNVFEGRKPAYLAVLFRMLLGGGFTRASARDELIRAFAWNDASAASHVAFTVPVLVHLGVARISETGTIVRED